MANKKDIDKYLYVLNQNKKVWLALFSRFYFFLHYMIQ